MSAPLLPVLSEVDWSAVVSGEMTIPPPPLPASRATPFYEPVPETGYAHTLDAILNTPMTPPPPPLPLTRSIRVAVEIDDDGEIVSAVDDSPLIPTAPPSRQFRSGLIPSDSTLQMRQGTLYALRKYGSSWFAYVVDILEPTRFTEYIENAIVDESGSDIKLLSICDGPAS
jgi:hypothetical protein